MQYLICVISCQFVDGITGGKRTVGRNNTDPSEVGRSAMTDLSNQTNDDAEPHPLLEGEDYYLENGLMVFTAAFLKKRGYCCESGCRHCPYGYVKDT